MEIDICAVANSVETNTDADAHTVEIDIADSAKPDSNAGADPMETDKHAATNSAKANCNANANSAETNGYACSSSRRQSVFGSPGGELQRQEIPPDGKRDGSCACAVPRLGAKKYRPQRHFNMHRYAER